MKCFGPTTQCKYIAGVGKKLNIPNTFTYICLNPAKNFDTLVDLLRTETLRGQEVIVSSVTPFEKLKKMPLIGPYLDISRFIDGTTSAVKHHLERHFPAN